MDSLIIKVSDLHDMTEDLKEKTVSLELLNAQYDSLLEKQASDAEIDALEKKIDITKDEVEKMSDKLNHLTYISIKGEGTNERTIEQADVLALNRKEKRAYKVMALLKTVSVFKLREVPK